MNELTRTEILQVAGLTTLVVLLTIVLLHLIFDKGDDPS